MDVLDTMQTTMRDVFANESLILAPRMSALDIDGWDSLSHTLLVLQLETVFCIELDLEYMALCRDVGELAEYIESLT